MYNFILQILIIFSLGIIIYLFAKKVPEISDVVEEGVSEKSSNFLLKADRLLAALPLEKLDFFVTQFLEKSLRKLRVFLLKLDNYLIHHLDKFKAVKKYQSTLKEKRLSLFEKEKEQSDEFKEEENILLLEDDENNHEIDEKGRNVDNV